MAKSLVALRGDVVSTPDFGRVAIATDHLIVAEAIEHGGKIIALAPGDQESTVLAEHGLDAKDVERLKVRAAFSFSVFTISSTILSCCVSALRLCELRY